MNNHHQASWDIYNSESEKYSRQYNQLYFSKIHKQFIRFLPSNPGEKVLDIGCGSGRDANSLARRGYIVTAVDPSSEMLNQAIKHNNHKNINWLNDNLPTLDKLKHHKYKFILVSAVWMHIPPHSRRESMNTLSHLVNNNGHIAITLRISSPDPAREIYSVSLDELLELAKETNLHPAYISRKTKDSFKRNEVTWIKVVLKKSTDTH